MPIDRTDTAALGLTSSTSFADFLPELGDCWIGSFLLSAVDFFALLELTDLLVSLERPARGVEVIEVVDGPVSASTMDAMVFVADVSLSALLVCAMKRLLARRRAGKRDEPC